MVIIDVDMSLLRGLGIYLGLMVIDQTRGISYCHQSRLMCLGITIVLMIICGYLVNAYKSQLRIRESGQISLCDPITLQKKGCSLSVLSDAVKLRPDDVHHCISIIVSVCQLIQEPRQVTSNGSHRLNQLIPSSPYVFDYHSCSSFFHNWYSKS